jgi:hypothetical protein
MATRERAHAVNLEKIRECSTIGQMNDVFNHRYTPQDLIDKTIRITSVRGRKSDYRDGQYAVAGFTSSQLGDGQFKIGGNAGRYLLGLNEAQLPVILVLRLRKYPKGHVGYQWEVKLV